MNPRVRSPLFLLFGTIAFVSTVALAIGFTPLPGMPESLVLSSLATLCLYGAALVDEDSNRKLALFGFGFVSFGLAVLGPVATASPEGPYGEAFIDRGIVAGLFAVVLGIAQFLRILVDVAFD